MFYNNTVEDIEGGDLTPEQSDDLDKLIYPHSVILSNPTAARDVYSELFTDTKFLIYISIWSKEPDKNYVVTYSVIDLNHGVNNTSSVKEYETLDCSDYRDFISSIYLLFPSFEKNILNFEKRQHTVKEYLEILEVWTNDD